MENLKKHIENIHRFGLPVVVAINLVLQRHRGRNPASSSDKCAYLSREDRQARDHWACGGEAGAEELARAVVEVVEKTKTDFSLLYPDTCTLWQKVGIICREIYGATDVLADKKLRDKFHALAGIAGFGDLPICMAKTQYSLSTDPGLKGRPKNFDVPLRDVMVSAGAGFVVVLTGDIMTMPACPRCPLPRRSTSTPTAEPWGCSKQRFTISGECNLRRHPAGGGLKHCQTSSNRESPPSVVIHK